MLLETATLEVLVQTEFPTEGEGLVKPGENPIPAYALQRSSPETCPGRYRLEPAGNGLCLERHFSVV